MLNALRKLAVAALATAAALSVVASGSPHAERAADRLIGIVGDRTSVNDYDDDMRRAKAAGIDAFALSIGVDGYTDQQLGYAYDSAARNVIKVCVEGTMADGESGNYMGLCQFSCNYGYCPRGPCKCIRYGSQVSPLPEIGARGCPLEGEVDGYKGLCSYTCNHGYCPDTACRKC